MHWLPQDRRCKWEGGGVSPRTARMFPMLASKWNSPPKDVPLRIQVWTCCVGQTVENLEIPADYKWTSLLLPHVVFKPIQDAGLCLHPRRGSHLSLLLALQLAKPEDHRRHFFVFCRWGWVNCYYLWRAHTAICKAYLGCDSEKLSTCKFSQALAIATVGAGRRKQRRGQRPPNHTF